jgi:hypothetical protein
VAPSAIGRLSFRSAGRLVVIDSSQTANFARYK